MVEYEEVKNKCTDFARHTNIEVTEQAQVLITGILNAVILDPHPTWQHRTREYLESQAHMYEDKIPEMLMMVVRDQQITEREDGSVTTFDILVDFKKLCDTFCFEPQRPS